eukprot:CAMPEP_0117745352 /NCGR_PEP_ID=MMETSP0947-20121206/7305_1 /TAXON_ID=44440 /ORGANISM="Chattonella subsalsa, Strain CCMP2191" /LENGTH=212 /DNA_ID=CAMNT_0005562479 /DNA_START=145 /DNA_END=783 /DNA_ORIENTATION=+
MCNGQVESGNFPGRDNLYVKYAFSFGNDWIVISGMDSGLSQIARKASGGHDPGVVWNFPIDITFKATNAHGWPRLAISVYGIDSIGRDVICGYGSVLIPPSPGQYTRTVHMYTPMSSSLLHQFLSWFHGAQPEFFDVKFVTQGEGREVTRVRQVGTIEVQLNVVTRGMEAFGYKATPESSGARSSLNSSTNKGFNASVTQLGSSFSVSQTLV